MSKVYNTPEAVEAAFYDAIERADIAAMDDVWSRDNNIVCIHPGSPRIEGRSDVLASFKQLFDDTPSLSFSIVDTLYTGNEELVVHLVREEVALDGELINVMLSTNIFHVEEGSWRMLLHHASPEPDFEADYDDYDEETDLEATQPVIPPVLH